MITIICDSSVDKEALEKDFVNEITMMTLCGIGKSDFYAFGSDRTDSENFRESEYFAKARQSIIENNLCEFFETDEGIEVDLGCTEDLGFALSFDLFNKNNYYDGFGSAVQTTIKYVAEQIKKKYPSVSIYGEFEMVGSAYQCVEHISTENGEIVSEIFEG